VKRLGQGVEAGLGGWSAQRWGQVLARTLALQWGAWLARGLEPKRGAEWVARSSVSGPGSLWDASTGGDSGAKLGWVQELPTVQAWVPKTGWKKEEGKAVSMVAARETYSERMKAMSSAERKELELDASWVRELAMT